jgi:hypothetical protein
MKIIKLVNWPESEKYLDCWDMEKEPDERNDSYNAFEACVTDYCKNNDIRLSGTQYQQTGEHIPIIEHEGKEYAFQASMREWGAIMYDLWGDGSDTNEKSDKRGYGYAIWAWDNPDEISHEQCSKCTHHYYHNVDTSKGVEYFHAIVADQNLNCRGIPIGPPKKRTEWHCDRWEAVQAV